MVSSYRLDQRKMMDPFCMWGMQVIDYDIQESFGNDDCIYSPEYYAVRSLLELAVTTSYVPEDGEPVLFDIHSAFKHIVFAADGLMKNLVFRDMDIPPYVWVLLEPHGVLSTHYEKFLYSKFVDKSILLQELVACYNNCDVKTDTDDVNVLRKRFDSAYKSLKRFYDIYLELASDDAKNALAFTAYVCLNKVKITAENVDLDTSTSYYIIRKTDIQLPADVDYLEKLKCSFTDNLHLERLDVFNSPYPTSLYEGYVLARGKNANPEYWLYELQNTICDIAILMQHHRETDFKKIFQMYLLTLKVVIEGIGKYAEPTTDYESMGLIEALKEGATLISSNFHIDKLDAILDVWTNLDTVDDKVLFKAIQDLSCIISFELRDIYDYETMNCSNMLPYLLKEMDLADDAYLFCAFGEQYLPDLAKEFRDTYDASHSDDDYDDYEDEESEVHSQLEYGCFPEDDLNDSLRKMVEEHFGVTIKQNVLDTFNLIPYYLPDYQCFPDKEAFDWFYGFNS